MKTGLVISSLLIPCLSSIALGQQAKLEGHVFDDEDNRVSAARIVAPGGWRRRPIPGDTSPQVIFKLSDERVKLRGEVAELRSQLTEDAFLREYSEKYASTLEQFLTAAQ